MICSVTQEPRFELEGDDLRLKLTINPQHQRHNWGQGGVNFDQEKREKAENSDSAQHNGVE